MGAWGIEAWENDRAVEWFGDVFDQYPIHQKIEETLLLDVKESHDKIRAAAYVLICFGLTDIWPIDALDRHCKLAVKKLDAIKRMEIYAHRDFQLKIDQEIHILRTRISEEYTPNNT